MRPPRRRFVGGRAAALGLALGLLASPGPALAERVAMRVGEHPGHGRVVFDWPERTGYRLEEAEGRVLLRFDQPAEFDLPARLPRNVLGFSAEGDTVTVTLRPGARARSFRLGGRVVLDLLNPPAAPRAAEPARAEAAPRPARPARAR
ncbi:hypothetical protein, partial [Roseomonas sp. BN140053]|uniref:hypothetical protein n=1 Tax=Roseomonas sp. BN140053 TaxID=3391898 RepID=UPI0039EC2406